MLNRIMMPVRANMPPMTYMNILKTIFSSSPSMPKKRRMTLSGFSAGDSTALRMEPTVTDSPFISSFCAVEAAAGMMAERIRYTITPVKKVTNVNTR